MTNKGFNSGAGERRRHERASARRLVRPHRARRQLLATTSDWVERRFTRPPAKSSVFPCTIHCRLMTGAKLERPVHSGARPNGAAARPPSSLRQRPHPPPMRTGRDARHTCTAGTVDIFNERRAPWRDDSERKTTAATADSAASPATTGESAYLRMPSRVIRSTYRPGSQRRV
jgi:hypothetical protein